MILFLKTMGMEKENFENKTPDILENNYQHYLELGGVVNEKDYDSALSRAKTTDKLDSALINEASQAKNMERFAGIELHSTKDVADPRIMLYEILRSDVQPKNIKYHHEQMTDQRIFREALRMLEDTDALSKLKDAYHTNRPIGTHCPLCGQTEVNESCP